MGDARGREGGRKEEVREGREGGREGGDACGKGGREVGITVSIF